MGKYLTDRITDFLLLYFDAGKDQNVRSYLDNYLAITVLVSFIKQKLKKKNLFAEKLFN